MELSTTYLKRDESKRRKEKKGGAGTRREKRTLPNPTQTLFSTFSTHREGEEKHDA